MKPYAQQAALDAGLSPDQLQHLEGVAEALPLPDTCADLVICTLVNVSPTTNRTRISCQPQGCVKPNMPA